MSNKIVDFLESNDVLDNTVVLDWDKYHEFVDFLKDHRLIHFFITKSESNYVNKHYTCSIVLSDMPDPPFKEILQEWIKTLFYGYNVSITLKFLNGKRKVVISEREGSDRYS